MKLNHWQLQVVIYDGRTDLKSILLTTEREILPLVQAELQNVIYSVSTFAKASCISASISWNPQTGESQNPSFALGFNSDTPQLNSAKVCNIMNIFPSYLINVYICALVKVGLGILGKT